jgi:hypothetical protein
VCVALDGVLPLRTALLGVAWGCSTLFLLVGVRPTTSLYQVLKYRGVRDAVG